MEDWSFISQNNIKERGGGILIDNHTGSFFYQSRHVALNYFSYKVKSVYHIYNAHVFTRISISDTVSALILCRSLLLYKKISDNEF